MSEETDRHSKALDVELIADPIASAEAEAKNGIRQFDAVVELIDYFLSPDRKVKLRPSHLLHLHRIALDGISSCAGNYRPAGIEIHGSRHQPVGAHLVPGEIEEMCDYVNENWDGSSPLHLGLTRFGSSIGYIRSRMEMGARRGLCPICCSAPGSDIGFQEKTQFRSRLQRTRRPTTRRWRLLTRNGQGRKLICPC